MKYLKFFEDELYNETTYWLVPTDKRFKNSLKKLNCPKDRIQNYVNYALENVLTIKDYRRNYMYIVYHPEYEPLKKWGYEYYNGGINDKWMDEKGYKFGGVINVDESEFVANKFNL